MLVVLLAAVELKQGHAQTLPLPAAVLLVPEALLSHVILNRVAPQTLTHLVTTMMFIIMIHAGT